MIRGTSSIVHAISAMDRGYFSHLTAILRPIVGIFTPKISSSYAKYQ